MGNVQPYSSMYQQAPTNMHYPGYIVPQSGQVPQTYPPQDMYYMQNMYTPFNNGK